MEMHTGPLLLLVQANVALEHERTFNAWYYQHVPTLLEIPGYQWGRRYINIVGETKYLALYTIEDESYLDSLLGPEANKRHVLANSEFAKFEQLQGLSDVRINVYRQISGTHLGHSLLQYDLPLSVVMLDCNNPSQEAEFDAWYTHSHVPNLVRISGYVSGARFRLIDHPALTWLKMSPTYLALYEWENLACVPSLSDPEQMHPDAQAELANWTAYGAPLADKMSWNVYRPIATHWPLEA